MAGSSHDPSGSGVGRAAGRGRRTAEYLDLRPLAMFTERTKYLDEALHADARHAHVSPPLLGAGVRHRMLTRFLEPSAGDIVVDLGCGSGQSLVWNAGSGASLVGVDVSPYFAAEALEQGWLVLGDLRRLPFEDAAFSKGYALDVFEHLSREGLDAVLAEIARVVRPGGRVFVYSHVRKNAWIATGVRAVNALSHGLARLGLIDLKQEHLRKSDHLNPLADIPDLERTVGAAGFRVAEIRYYTPIVGAFVAERDHAARRARDGSPRRAFAARPGRSRLPEERGGAAGAGRRQGPAAVARSVLRRGARAHEPDDARRVPVRPDPVGPVLRGARAPGRTAPVMTRAARIVAAAPGLRAASGSEPGKAPGR